MMNLILFLIIFFTLFKYNLHLTLTGFAQITEPVWINGQFHNVPRVIAMSDWMWIASHNIDLFNAWEKAFLENKNKPPITTEESTKFDERLIEKRGLLYGTSKIVNFMSSDKRRRFSVAIAGSASLYQELHGWSESGVTVDSIDELASIMRIAVNHDRSEGKFRNRKFLASDWNDVYNIRFDTAEGYEYEKRENKYLHLSGQGKKIAKEKLSEWKTTRPRISREKAIEKIKEMYDEVARRNPFVSASHLIHMHPYETRDPLANDQPAPELDTKYHEKDGEREKIESENEFTRSRTFEDIVDDSIESGFWKKFGKGWREDEDLRKEVEKWPKLKKHLEEVHGRSPGPQARKKFGAKWREQKEARNIVEDRPMHSEEEDQPGSSRRRSPSPQPQPGPSNYNSRARIHNIVIDPMEEEEGPPGPGWRKVGGQWKSTDSEMLMPSSRRNRSPRGNLPPKSPPSRPIRRRSSSNGRRRKNSGKK